MLTLASASGNVFGFLRAEAVPASFNGPRWARVLCARGEGFGLDGLFLLRPTEGAVLPMEHWEPDGSRTFCSNGTRAAARLMAPTFGEYEAISSGERVRVKVEEDEVGLGLAEGEGYGLRPAALGLERPCAYGWTGTPHLVIEVPSVEAVDLPTFAPPLRHHPALPNGANVSIVELLEPGRARIRSWERGVEGETLCCGQGCAVAGAWLAQRSGVREWSFQPAGRDPVRVSLDQLRGGAWSGLWISGPVHRLGEVALDPALRARLEP